MCVIKSPVESIMNKLLSPWKPTSVRTLTNLWPEVKTVCVNIKCTDFPEGPES